MSHAFMHLYRKPHNSLTCSYHSVYNKYGSYHGDGSANGNRDSVVPPPDCFGGPMLRLWVMSIPTAVMTVSIMSGIA